MSVGELLICCSSFSSSGSNAIAFVLDIFCFFLPPAMGETIDEEEDDGDEHGGASRKNAPLGVLAGLFRPFEASVCKEFVAPTELRALLCLAVDGLAAIAAVVDFFELVSLAAKMAFA